MNLNREVLNQISPVVRRVAKHVASLAFNAVVFTVVSSQVRKVLDRLDHKKEG